MPEILTREIVAGLLDELVVAFPQKGRDIPKLAGVYRDALSDLDGAAVRYAAKRHIREGKYFPKPAELREHGAEWMRRHMPPTEVVAQHSGTICHCGSKFEWLEGFAPQTDERWTPLITRDGEWIQLGRFARYLCPNCTPPARYTADDDAPEAIRPAMRIFADGRFRVPLIVLRRHPAFAGLLVKHEAQR